FKRDGSQTWSAGLRPGVLRFWKLAGPEAGVSARQKFLNGRWRFDFWQPGRAALFDGFNGNLLPFLALVFCALVVESRHDAFGQQRHDAMRAQFHGFLDDGLDDFALGQCLEQSDLAGWRRNEI